MHRFAIALSFVCLAVLSLPQPAASQSTSVPLRPGSLFMFEDPDVGRNELFKGYCTLNFLFYGSDGARYMGTAAHCQPEPVGDMYSDENADKAWDRGEGPVAMDTRGNRIGEFAYAIQNAPETVFSGVTGGGNRELPVGDFALIRLDPEVPASASVCHFGGPWGVFRTASSQPLELRMYGNGYGLGYEHATETHLPAAARPLFAPTGAPDKEYIFANAVASVSDSGSPVVTTDGMAVGVFSGIWEGVRVEDRTEEGNVVIARLNPLKRAAEKKLEIDLDLKRAKRVEGAPAVGGAADSC